MFRAVQMSKISILVLKTHLEAVKSQIEASGVFHVLDSVKEFGRTDLSGEAPASVIGRESDELLKHCGYTGRLACLVGWLPSASLAEFRERLSGVTGGSALIEELPDTGDDAPVAFSKKPGCFKPFELLVANFGIPAYRELDPTVFVALSFVLLFGFMFGDIGQGGVLLFTGLIMRYVISKKHPAMASPGVIIGLCGFCAVLFGFAYGSVFGYEHCLHPLWLNPMSGVSIQALLLTTIGVGIVLTCCAIIINIVNHFISGQMYEGIFSRFGICGLLFYVMALGLGVWCGTGHAFALWMIYPLLVPLALLYLKSVIWNVSHGHGLFGEEGMISTLIESGIEVMEVFTGYISGTVSFVRVGAFAISHAALCYAVFTIVSLFDGVSCGWLYQAIVLILGNLLIIAFEGMVAGIQCVRLEYYELFGKYFGGNGKEYKPIISQR